ALGLNTLAALAGAPQELLTARFGPNMGRELARRARFEHDGEVGSPHKVASESRERTFDTDLRDPQHMREALARMASELCQSLAAHRRIGRTIGIKVRLDDFTTVTRAHTVPEPTRDPALVSEVALRLLGQYAPSRPVRLLGVRVAGLAAAGASGEGSGGPAGSPVPAGRGGRDQPRGLAVGRGPAA